MNYDHLRVIVKVLAFVPNILPHALFKFTRILIFFFTPAKLQAPTVRFTKGRTSFL